ncbi:hypothetical protein GDO78_009175 [Eleutherodactylus coqui]|uniref:Uncharacterized protein n=1 Tax=Eleutherodactylus coqui TaxID=57060 RepID=A0A8J6F951_ELECQ|nr:hypothetical protein GDO78_009175 [Eleutherodactylus coqui]
MVELMAGSLQPGPVESSSCTSCPAASSGSLVRSPEKLEPKMLMRLATFSVSISSSTSSPGSGTSCSRCSRLGRFMSGPSGVLPPLLFRQQDGLTGSASLGRRGSGKEQPACAWQRQHDGTSRELLLQERGALHEQVRGSGLGAHAESCCSGDGSGSLLSGRLGYTP